VIVVVGAPISLPMGGLTQVDTMLIYTTDGGATWSEVTDTLVSVSAIAAHPTRRSRFLLSLDHAGIWELDVDADLDADGDGYPESTDCDDSEATTYPGAPETCGDGVDASCDGTEDEGMSLLYYVDADVDGFATTTVAGVYCPGAQPAGTSHATEVDCDDTDADVHPFLGERCDGVDQDCDGTVDEDPMDGTVYHPDLDLDGFGGITDVIACSAPSGYLLSDGDCDDTDATVYVGANDVCGDGIDQNCNGTADDGLRTVYRDWDNDGYGATVGATRRTSCTSLPGGFRTTNTDCDDRRAATNPGASDTNSNGIDDDCDGVPDM
jgi:hypothetical protein